MAINASLAGRLRNTSLPKAHALLPVFEAVVNAIQSVDAAHSDMDSARIVVEVLRGQQLPLGFGNEADSESNLSQPITGFLITDNGEGFHEQNMQSFEMLDSQYKAAQGCRGVGRLIWLKAFDRVRIYSTYQALDGTLMRRVFDFSEQGEISNHVNQPAENDIPGSEVRLIGFRDTYRHAAAKTTAIIARSILEHCLWHFVRDGGAPNIVVIDGPDTVDLNSTYDDYMPSSSAIERITVKGREFDLVHLRLKANAKNQPQLNWCAANRVVLEENLTGKIRGLHGKLRDSDSGSEFFYTCFLTSDYLDESVSVERTAFHIPESAAGGESLFENEPAMSEIRASVLAAIERHLREHLEKVRRAGRERVERFVASKAPRYRPILRHIDESELNVDPQVTEKELELQLHKHLTDLEAHLLEEGQSVLNASAPEGKEYGERLRTYLEKVDDVKKSDLAAYVSRRRVILDLLGCAIQADEHGRYVKEDVVHTLIMPMRKASDEVHPEACNLWVIDEGLAFHNYLASDKPISAMPITGSTERLEPDLLALKLSDNPILVSERDDVPLASITVVEFKRPMRNDAAPGPEKDPLDQALQYLERVRKGGVRTATGRPIPRSEQIPGFCYVISDLTPTVEARCKAANLRLTHDQMGYFGYNDNYKAYIEVLSFDRLLNMAHQRNRAFFDKLGLPVT